MTSTVLVTLALSVPLGLLAWVGALAVDRTGAGMKVRGAVWALAFAAPVLLTPMALAVRALEWSPARPAPLPVHTEAAPLIPAPVSQAAYESTPEGPDWAAILLTVVIVGAALRLSILILHGVSLAWTARRARPLAGDFGLPVRLYDGETPVLAGLIKPVVLIPRALAETLTPSQIALICAHERAHLRAGDHIANLLESSAMATFWFNPVLGAIRAGLSAVREEACDAAALSGAERPTRRVYAEVLLSAIRHAGAAEPAVAFTGFYRARSARRLRAILTPQGKSAKAAAAMAAGIGLALAGAAGGLAYAFAGAQEPAAARAAQSAPATSAPATRAFAQGPAMAAATPLAPTAAMLSTRSIENDIAVRASDLRQLAADGAPTVPVATQATSTRASFTTADINTLNALNTLLVDTRMQRIDVRSRLQTLEKVPVENWLQIRNDEKSSSLIRQRDERLESYNAALANFSPATELMVARRAAIDALNAQLARQAALIRADMAVELQVLDTKEANILAEITTLRAQLAAR